MKRCYFCKGEIIKKKVQHIHTCEDKMILSPNLYNVGHVPYVNICLEHPSMEHDHVQRDIIGNENRLILAKCIKFFCRFKF